MDISQKLKHLAATGTLLTSLLSPHGAASMDQSKVLSVTAGDYAASTGKPLQNYDLLGVYPAPSVRITNSLECAKALTETVNTHYKGAEAIVDVVIRNYNTHACYGTAIIPKK